MKIRGTAHHIGEKYLQLARDAQSSGDPVMAESYLQHAEHYFRLIAAAQQAQQQSAYGYQRTAGEQAEADEDDGDDDFSSLPDRFASPAERVVTPPPQPAPQPYGERAYANGGERPAYEARQDRGERQSSERQGSERQDRNERYERPAQDRPPYQDRQHQDRQPQTDRQDARPERYDNRQDRGDGQRTDGQPRYENRNGRGDRAPYPDRSFPERSAQDRNGLDRNGQDRGTQDRGTQDRSAQDRGPQDRGQQERPPHRDFDNRGSRNGNRAPREFRGDTARGEPRQADIEPAVSLPAFITTPVRIPPEPTPVSEPIVAETPDVPSTTVADAGNDEAVNFAMRPRRRRRTKAELMESAGEAANEARTPDPVNE